MEKTERNPEPGDKARQQPTTGMWRAACLLTAGIAATILLRGQKGSWFPFGRVANNHLPLSANTETPFDWDTAVTKPDLDYSSCYDGRFQCARLELPMDWFNDTTNATISLAVIKKPAVVAVTDPQYGGAILLNPGGPGGLGISFLVTTGHQVRKTLDSDTEDGKYYDLISFDPRGVGDSEPSIHCFKNNNFAQSWGVRSLEEGDFSSSDAALGRLFSMSAANGKSCSLPVDGPDFRKYITTASAARDMLEIVEKHGQWREQEAERLLSLQKQSVCGSRKINATEARLTTRYQPGKEKIQYWGFSYGTYLGNTFAAMFPDRVERIVVDGVVDAYDYKAGLWSTNLMDTEKVVDAFYSECARAGYPACPLANETGDSTAQGVRQRTDNILASLYHNPLPVVGPNPEVITYSDVRILLFGALYTPMKSFGGVARRLTELEQGNGTKFAEALSAYHSFECSAPAYKDRGRSIGINYDGTMAISCTDGNDQTWVNRTVFEDFVKEQAALSPTIGHMWSMIRMHCIHYEIRPVYRFVGPWTAKTSHPLLMIGNTADPVTPVRHAHKMAEGFEGAVVITQDSAGHCSLSTFSSCTEKYVRAYFQTGALPPGNTTCAADEYPFGPAFEHMDTASFDILDGRARYADMSDGLVAAGGGFMRHIVRTLDVYE